MPAWLAVVILGVIEGITEFLPVSSTGHLLLVENANLVSRQSDLFNITIQSGAAVAVLALSPLVKRWMHLDTLRDTRDLAGRPELGEPQAAGANLSGEVKA